MNDSVLTALILAIGGIVTGLSGVYASWMYQKTKREEIVLRAIVEMHRDASEKHDPVLQEHYERKIKLFAELKKTLRA